jgi:hypothetical protein
VMSRRAKADTIADIVALPPQRRRRVSAYVWCLPDEKPGTLKEIFDAEDSRRPTLALVEIDKLDGFRACSEAAGAPVDPNDLILAVMGCMSGPKAS